MKFAILSCLGVLLYSASTLAQAEGGLAQTAEIQVAGTLLESACYLDPASAYQILQVGDLSTARMARIGDQGAPWRCNSSYKGACAAKAVDRTKLMVCWCGARSNPSPR